MGKVAGSSNLAPGLRKRMAQLRSSGSTKSEVAKALGCHPRTVQRYWNKADTRSFKDRPRSGRPKVLSPNSKRFITSSIRDKWGTSPASCAARLNLSDRYKQCDKTVSVSTVQRYVTSQPWGKVAYKRPVKPLLTEKNKADRLKFCDWLECNGYLRDDHIGRVKRSHILWTDESPVELFPVPNRQNTRMRTADKTKITPAQRPKNGLKIMVAGGMNAYGLTKLYVVPEKSTINADFYMKEILPVYKEACERKATGSTKIDEAKIFFSDEQILLQQDGAPAHTAKKCQEFCGQNFPNFLPKDLWPGNSPDLNPVEHLWAKLQESVLIEPRPRNREQLIDRVQETWGQIGQDYLRSLAESIPKRVVEVRAANGGHTTH